MNATPRKEEEMPDKKHRLVLTSEELSSVKDALFKFVTNGCEKPYLYNSSQMEALPAVADVLLNHFGG